MRRSEEGWEGEEDSEEAEDFQAGGEESLGSGREWCSGRMGDPRFPIRSLGVSELGEEG